MLVLTGLAVLQVVMRYVFAHSLEWVEEVSVILMIWCAWLGAAELWLQRGHLAVDLLLGSTGSKRRLWFRRGFDLAALALGLALFVVSMETLETFSGMDLDTMEFDIRIKYMPVAIGGLVVAMAALLALLGQAGGKASDGD